MVLWWDLIDVQEINRSCWPSRAMTRQPSHLIAQPGASCPSPTSPYHHIADTPLRGHREELRVMLTMTSHWSTAGYRRHGTDSTAKSDNPRTAIEIDRICIAATVRLCGDDYPRMILRRSQEGGRKWFYPGVRAEVERDVTKYKRKYRSEEVSSDAGFETSNYKRQWLTLR